MKPGTLSALNRNLCLLLQPDRVYTLRPQAPMLRALAVPPPDIRPVAPLLPGQTGPAQVDGRAVRDKLHQTLLGAGLLALVVTLNLSLLGFERVERARERHLLGRAIAEREQHALRLVEANRHITGVLRVQNALLQQRVSNPASTLARATPTRRPPTAGI